MNTSNETPEVWTSDKMVRYGDVYCDALLSDFRRCRELLAEARREAAKLREENELHGGDWQPGYCSHCGRKSLPAKPPREWTRETPTHGRWWHHWNQGNSYSGISLRDQWSPNRHVPDSWWFSWQNGDSKNDLPPLPDAATGKQSTTVSHPSEITDTRKLSDRVGAINMKLHHVEEVVGSAEDRLAAIENRQAVMLDRIEAIERMTVAMAKQSCTTGVFGGGMVHTFTADIQRKAADIAERWEK